MSVGSERPQRAITTYRDLHLGAGYTVSLPQYEGPLDLLLTLIEREELDINSVSLMAVTEQYLATLHQLEDVEPGALADFLVVASQLLLIKSSRLLPKPVVVEGEEEEDTGGDLIQQLLEYRRFKQAAAELRLREELGLRHYVRVAPPPGLDRHSLRPLDLSDVDGPRLQAALRRALQRVPRHPPPPRVQPYTVTVAEQIEVVRMHLAIARADGVAMQPIPFSRILGKAYGRLEVVVTFLAVLELIKQHEVVAVQQDTFGEIWLAPAPQPQQGDATESRTTDAQRSEQE